MRTCDWNHCDRNAVVASDFYSDSLVSMDSDPMDTTFSCHMHGWMLLPCNGPLHVITVQGGCAHGCHIEGR